MYNKRILILHDSSSGPLQLQNSRHKVVTCNNTTEALSILMGGSSAFGKDDYAKTGKVRPEVLVLDSAFMESFEGFELLEIIRKYYSLQSVRIFIFDKNITMLDPAIFSRYKISGKLSHNFNLDELTENNTVAAKATGTAGAFLSIGLFAGIKDWVTTALNFVKGQSLVITGVKTAVAGKVAIATSCVVVAGFAVSPIISGQKASGNNKPPEPKITSIQHSITEPAANKAQTIRTLTLETIPAAKKKTANKKKTESPVVKAAETQQPAVKAESEQPAVAEKEARPERQFRIGVEEAEEVFDTQTTQ
jgi:hypothetical protein